MSSVFLTYWSIKMLKDLKQLLRKLCAPYRVSCVRCEYKLAKSPKGNLLVCVESNNNDDYGEVFDEKDLYEGLKRCQNAVEVGQFLHTSGLAL